MLEAETCGYGASGRNGGLRLSSLTHGISNGMARFADEMPVLERLGDENFAGIEADLATHGIDCDFEENGDVVALLEPHELSWVDEEVELARRFGHEVEVLDREQVRAELASPTYIGGIWDKTGSALLHPGKLADGLRQGGDRAGRAHPRAHAGDGASARADVQTEQGRSTPARRCSQPAPTSRCCAR